MRILLTGASGLVGSAFAISAAAQGHEVIGVVGEYAGQIPGLTSQRSCDLADAEAIRGLVRAVSPEIVVNAAAVSDVSQCIVYPDRAYRLNVELPLTLAEESRRIEAMLVHLSSDQVFSGTKGNYSRGEETCPINGYAKLKATAEDRLCANTAGRIVVLRLPPLLGNSLGGRRSLHERLLASWNERKAVRLFTDEIRQPCSVRNLANAILDLLWVRGAEGIYHWAGREAVSRFELGCLIRRHFGLSEQQAPIIAVTREEERAVATGRPANLTLDLDPLDRMLATRPQTLAEAIADLSLPGWFACSDRRDAPSNPDPQVTSQPCEKPS